MSLNPRGVIFGYGIQASDFETGVAASAGLPVRGEDEIIKFDPGHQVIETPIMRGKHGDYDDDRIAGVLKPTVSLPLYCRLDILKLFLDQTWDPTADGDGWDYALHTMANSDVDSTKGLSVWKRLTSGSSNDQRMTGVVGSSITIESSSENQVVNLDVDCMGVGLDTDQDGSGGTYTISAVDSLLHENLTLDVGGSGVACAEVSVTINWNLVGIVDDNAAIQDFLLGKLEITGSLRMPWADADILDDFISATETDINIKWGAAASSDYLELDLPVQWTEPSDMAAGDARLEETVNFKLSETSGTAPTIGLEV